MELFTLFQGVYICTRPVCCTAMITQTDAIFWEKQEELKTNLLCRNKCFVYFIVSNLYSAKFIVSTFLGGGGGSTFVPVL